jgi:micrococcal nuclease
VNVELVRRGAATVYFYRGERGRYAAQLLAAARQARAARRGLWGACRVAWNPNGPATTAGQAAQPAAGGCEPSYPDVCIASPPPDLDCADVPHRGFRVVGADPHRFDGDGDGRGCE